MSLSSPKSKFVLLAAVLVALGACNNRAWYKGLQTSSRVECEKNREECSGPVGYDAYKQERKEALGRR